VRSVRILGVRVDDVTMDQALDSIVGMVSQGGPHQVVTVNPEFIMRASREPAFAAVLERADLAIPDGQGLLWAARVLGKPLRARVAGSDLVPLLAECSGRHGFTLFLLGAAPGVAELAAERLTQRYSEARIVGTHAGSPRAEDDDASVELIQAAAPDVLLVAYGAPAQDLWIARNQPRLQIPVAIGIGGSLDFIAGVQRRAPAWMRERGLEWLYRLVQQPWRWRRMLALPVFAWRVLALRVKGRGEY
jgi:N-acetylglucosaminyldiphosphoundecaprenol N-acetyl-beta-D-mannosaminyltransferase